jgi:hypothetical protein
MISALDLKYRRGKRLVIKSAVPDTLVGSSKALLTTPFSSLMVILQVADVGPTGAYHSGSAGCIGFIQGGAKG